jgi:hypothetical protein
LEKTNVEVMGEGAFSHCPSLIGVHPSPKLEEIPPYAFARCESLISVGLPEGLESIGSGAFLGCTKLSNITIPASVRGIADDAFLGGVNTLYVHPGSYAERYAEKVGLRALSLEQTSPIPDPPAPEQLEVSFTGGNIANGHHVTKSGDWLFFSSDSGIEKMREDGSGRVKISDHSNAHYLFAVGDRLYFRDYGTCTYGGKIYTMDFEGNHLSAFSSDVVGAVNIENQWLYYQDRSGPTGGSLNILRLPLTGGTPRMVSTACTLEFCVSGDIVYYINFLEDRDIYRVNGDGSDDRCAAVCECRMFCVDNGWIYYIDRADKLYRVKEDGTGTHHFPAAGTCGALNVSGGKVFYFSRRGELRCMEPDGSGDRLLAKVSRMYRFCIVGEWIYCYYTPARCELFRVKTDGTRVEQISPAGACSAIPASQLPKEATSIDEFEVLNYNILRKYKGNAPEVIVPTQFGRIFPGAFDKCETLEKVVVPKEIKEISIGAFGNCPNLRSIVIEGKNVTIGIPNFNGCPKLAITCRQNSGTHEQLTRAFQGPLEFL